MIIADWELSGNRIFIRVYFTKEEMRILEVEAGIKKADPSSWITFTVDANKEKTDCYIYSITHYTSKEIHNGNIGKEYNIPAKLFSDHAINYILNFAFKKLGCCNKLDILECDYSGCELPYDYYFPEEDINSEPIICG